MLLKLLKYDLKYMLKNMIVFYALSVFFAITTRLLHGINGSVIFGIVYQISVGCMFSMIASTLINVLMRSWVRFRDSVFKDEAYLTHTLPVTKGNIYYSKFLQSIIFLFISFSSVIVSLFIAFFSKENWAVLKKYIVSFSEGISISTPFFIAGVIICLLLELFNALQCGYFGLLIGHRMNKGKIGFSVLFGFIAYMASQTVTVLFTFFIGLFNSNVMDLFKNNAQIEAGAFKLLMIIYVLIYALIIGVMSILCRKILEKGVNIE